MPIQGNDEGLLGLVAALKQGMDPTTAYGLVQDMEAEQAEELAMRQQRLGGLADLLSGAAMQGMPYSGASALAEAAPGPAGPAVQNMLSALYPTGEVGPPPTNASGAVMDIASRGPQNAAPGSPMAQTGQGAQALSPTYAPPPPSPTEQLAVAEATQQQALQPLWTEFVQNAQDYAANGRLKEQFLMDAAKAYPELFSSDIQTVQQIVLTVFAGQEAAAQQAQAGI